MDPKLSSPSSSPLEPKASVQPPTPIEHTPEWYKARNRFIISLVLWLIALPVIALVQFVVQFVLAGSDQSGTINIIKIVINLVSVVGGILAIFGWVVPLILGIKWSQKK